MVFRQLFPSIKKNVLDGSEKEEMKNSYGDLKTKYEYEKG